MDEIPRVSEKFHRIRPKGCSVFFSVFCVALALFAVYISYSQKELIKRLQSERKTLDTLPISVKATEGAVKMTGIPSDVIQPPIEPRNRKKVIYYYHHISELRTEYSERFGSESTWVTVVNERRCAERFSVNGIKIFPEGASFYGTIYSTEGSVRREKLEVVPLDSKLLVVGNCRSVNGEHIIDRGGDVFIISSLSEDELLKRIADEIAKRESASVFLVIVICVLFVLASTPFVLPLILRKVKSRTYPSDLNNTGMS